MMDYTMEICGDPIDQWKTFLELVRWPAFLSHFHLRTEFIRLPRRIDLISLTNNIPDIVEVGPHIGTMHSQDLLTISLQ